MTSLNRLLKNRAALFAVGLVVLSLVWVIAGEKPTAEMLASVSDSQGSSEKAEIESTVTMGLFYASVICLALSFALLLTVRRWGRTLPCPMPCGEKIDRRISPRVFWIVIGLAVLTGAGLRLHLAKGSLWWDELWNIKHTMVGYSRPDAKKAGAMKFREVEWQRTLWNYRKPTNHPPMAVAARLSNDTWRKLSGAEPGSFNEVAIRLPSLLAGLGAIVLTALLLRRWGFGAAGLVAAFLLAVHPWHLRYGVEARGYSFIVFFTALACYALTRALESGRWRDWSLFGLAQFFLMWSLPISVWYAAAFGVAALVGVWCQKENRRELIARVLVVNVVAGMAYCAVFLPNVLQLLSWGKINDHQYLSWGLLWGALQQMCFGMQNAWPDTVDAGGLAGLSERPAALVWLVFLMIAAAVMVGAWRLFERHWNAVLMIAALELAAVGYLLVTWQAEHHFYERYLIYLAVPWGAVLAIGLTRLLPRKAAVPVFFVAYLWVVWPQLKVLNTRSYAPFREAAEFVQAQPDGEKAKVVCYGLGGRVFSGYDADAELADNRERLQKFVDADVPLYVVYGYRDFNSHNPGTDSGFALIDDPALFEEVAAFPGIDSMFYFRVMRRR